MLIRELTPEPIPSALPLKPVGMQGQTRQAVLPSKNASQDEMEKFTQVWIPRLENLNQRIEAAFERMQRVMQPHERTLTQNIEFKVYNDVKTNTSMDATFEHGKGIIQAELTLFWDAPDEVLIWILAHELGHIRYRHGYNDPTAQYKTSKGKKIITDPDSGYNQQYTGDASTLAVMQNPKRKNQTTATYQPDGAQVVKSEEAEANAFANDIMLRMGYKSARVFEFFHKNQQEYTDWKNRSNYNRDSGQQQIDQALKQGFQLSQPAKQHLDKLMQTQLTEMSDFELANQEPSQEDLDTIQDFVDTVAELEPQQALTKLQQLQQEYPTLDRILDLIPQTRMVKNVALALDSLVAGNKMQALNNLGRAMGGAVAQTAAAANTLQSVAQGRYKDAAAQAFSMTPVGQDISRGQQLGTKLAQTAQALADPNQTYQNLKNRVLPQQEPAPVVNKTDELERVKRLSGI